MSAKLLREEAEAWRAVARHIDALPCGNLAYLCWYIRPEYECWRPRVAATVRESMFNRVRSHLELGSLMRRNEEGNTLEDARLYRVLAALFLALECEDEARALRASRRSSLPSQRQERR